MSDEDYFRQQDLQRTLASLRAAARRGDPLTRQDRVALFSDEAVALSNKLRNAMRDRTEGAGLRHAFDVLIGEMLARSVLQDLHRDALASRVAELGRPSC